MHTGIRQTLPELIFGAGVTAFAFALLPQSAELPERSALFPTAVLWCTAAAGAGIFIEGVVKALRADGSGAAPAGGRGWIAGIVLPAELLFASALLLYAVGFYLTAPVMTLALFIAHSQRATGRGFARETLLKGLVIAAAMTAGMYLVFKVIIGLPSPSGALI